MTGIEPHIPVFDKSQRTDGAFSREDFTYDHASDAYRCPAGKTPALSSAVHDPADRRDERQLDTLPGQQARLRGVSPEAALLPPCTDAQDRQDRRVPDLAPPAQKGRDAVRSSEAYSEARSAPTTWAERRPRRVPPRRDRSEPPQTRQADPDAVAPLSDVRPAVSPRPRPQPHPGLPRSFKKQTSSTESGKTGSSRLQAELPLSPQTGPRRCDGSAARRCSGFHIRHPSAAMGVPGKESQPIPPTQQLCGSSLRRDVTEALGLVRRERNPAVADELNAG